MLPFKYSFPGEGAYSATTVRTRFAVTTMTHQHDTPPTPDPPTSRPPDARLLGRPLAPGSPSSPKPNFFIVGAPKAGTTSVYQYCRRHPDIFMSELKEPHFFSEVESLPAWRGQTGALHTSGRFRAVPTIRSLDEYLSLFDASGGYSVRGEASTSYLSDTHAAAKIDAFSPAARVTAIIRDPVHRALSSYDNHVREGIETRPLLTALADELEGRWDDWSMCYLRSSMYADQIERYSHVFGDRFDVLIYEELISEPKAHMVRLFSSLGLDPAPAAAITYRAYNARHRPRNAFARLLLAPNLVWRAGRRLPEPCRTLSHRLLLRSDIVAPEVSPDALALLVKSVTSQYTKLEDLLGRRLPWDPRAALARG